MGSRIEYAITTALALMIGCSSPEPRGRVVVAVTVDWEGAYLSPDGIDAIDALRAGAPMPLTHFVSAGYFTKADPSAALTEVTSSIAPGDELAIHVHGWASLARTAGIAPRTSPSFMTGTDELLDLENSDTGFDLDLDAYSVSELRALIRTTRDLLARVGPVSSAFRAGGYLASPRMLQALRDEGLTIDSSAIAPALLEDESVFAERVAEVWGTSPSSQPWLLERSGGTILELPIAAVADYATTEQVTAVLDAAIDAHRQQPDRDVFVVLALHQETADATAPRIRQGIDKARGRNSNLVFVTITDAAARARAQLARGSR